ncbi:type VI secretion system amidase immunity protein Tai4 [Ralstonia syzygii]|nr:type VI secretion system amidase immunity protein Tai4 [Ralstonia syzygii]
MPGRDRTVPCHAQGNAGTSPQAATRTYAQHDKDMVLATCIANACRNDKDATADAGSSGSALQDETVYDMEKSPDAVRSLVDRYLARNYANPLAEAEVKGLCFDLLNASTSITVGNWKPWHDSASSTRGIPTGRTIHHARHPSSAASQPAIDGAH